MHIIVRLGAPLSQVLGQSKVPLALPEGATVADALGELRNRYPDFEAGLMGKGLPRFAQNEGRGSSTAGRPLDDVLYVLFLNARPVSFDRASNTLLRDGDRLYLFLPVAGG